MKSIKKYKLLRRISIDVKKVGSQVTLEMIYDEVIQVNRRLSLIEDAVEELIVKVLPEVQ